MMREKQFKRLCCAAMIAFQSLFLYIMIFFRDVIVAPNPFFKPVSRQYWEWYLSREPSVPYETELIALVSLLQMLSTLLFLAADTAAAARLWKAGRRGRRRVLFTLGGGAAAAAACYLLILWGTRHVRLFMLLLLPELLSLILLCLLLLPRAGKER